MSSGFVSAGTNDAPTERDAEWHAAQADIETARRRKEEGQFAHQEGKTLYEVLQANKAAKQDAFEEAQKLRNQFRSLEQDEVEFLDEVLESTRREEITIKKETRERLDAFRRQQSQADQALKTGTDAAESGTGEGTAEEGLTWGKGSKRKRRQEERSLGLKKRRESSTQEEGGAKNGGEKVVGAIDTTKGDPAKTVQGSSEAPGQKPGIERETSTGGQAGHKKEEATVQSGTPTKPQATLNLGLGGYSSEED